MLSEADFYKVEIGESGNLPQWKDGSYFSYMPDGLKFFYENICENKYGVFYLSVNKEWRCYGSRKNYKDAEVLYNKIIDGTEQTMHNMKYPCIAEIYPASTEVDSPKTLKEYLEYEPEREKECSWSLMRCFGRKFHETKTEITKSLADHLVKHSKRKKYFKDCVALSDLIGRCKTHGWTVLTREFGKYYCIGYWDLSQCEEYRGPSYVEKDIKIPFKTASEALEKISKKIQEIGNIPIE